MCSDGLEARRVASSVSRQPRIAFGFIKKPNVASGLRYLEIIDRVIGTLRAPLIRESFCTKRTFFFSFFCRLYCTEEINCFAIRLGRTFTEYCGHFLFLACRSCRMVRSYLSLCSGSLFENVETKDANARRYARVL